MDVLRDVFRRGPAPAPGSFEATAADAADATISAGALITGTVIAARRFNEDRTRVPTLVATGFLAKEAVGATVEAAHALVELADVAVKAAFVDHLFRNRDS